MEFLVHAVAFAPHCSSLSLSLSLFEDKQAALLLLLLLNSLSLSLSPPHNTLVNTWFL
jgi:hypothetical protein